MSKTDLLSFGKELMAEFCEANRLSEPEVKEYPASKWCFPKSACAYYRTSVVHISPAHCAGPGYGGMAWSWPGYVIDRTPYGVIQHELGHHVDYIQSKVKGAYGGDFSERLRRMTNEPKLTNYCPNDWEWFAEIFRLFVTKSDLLRVMRPRTWGVIRSIYRPVVDRPWAEVLKNAPPRTLIQAGKKAGGPISRDQK